MLTFGGNRNSSCGKLGDQTSNTNDEKTTQKTDQEFEMVEQVGFRNLFSLVCSSPLHSETETPNNNSTQILCNHISSSSKKPENNIYSSPYAEKEPIYPSIFTPQ